MSRFLIAALFLSSAVYVASASECFDNTKQPACEKATQDGEQCVWCTSAATGNSCVKESDAKTLPSSVFKCYFDEASASQAYNSSAPLVSTAGVDVSSLVSTSDWSCLKSSGYSFGVPRGYRSSGSVDPNVCGNLNNMKSAGIAYRDVYLFPCPTCSSSASSQMKSLVDYLHTNCASSWSGRVWLDIEGSQYWTGSTTNNKNWYQALVDSCSTYGVKCGVYASQSQWQAIFGSTSYCYGSYLPLWYAHYDGSASFSDYSKYSFGCWSTPFAKQYAGTTSVCGASVDKDYSADFSKY